ncbi:MAG: hypothetical protein M3T56_02905 [Chloroflexota bacterium]|nr:hypothetical protein [Chloroflexota bacterium]
MTVDDRSTTALDAWLGSLSGDSRRELYILLDELVSGLDVSRHNRFGFLRLRAEFETQGQGPLGAQRREIFGCSLEQLRDAVAATLGSDAVKPPRPRSPLEALRDRVRRRGHPDFR